MWAEDFIGQQHIIEDLQIHIKYHALKWIPLPHMMFYGLPGLGKTTLAKAIGSDSIEKTGTEMTEESLWKMLKEIYDREVLFIDEIHRMPTKVAEILYGPLQIINNMQLKDNVGAFMFEGVKIRPFTLIGATTNPGDIAKPLRDRIVLSYKFNPYKDNEIVQILGFYGCDKNIAKIISMRARGIPRIALNYYVRIRSEGETIEDANKMFKRIGVNKDGATIEDMAVLEFLMYKTASSNTICRSLGIDSTEYTNMYEPFLLSNGLIEVTAKGRAITKQGKEYVENNC